MSTATTTTEPPTPTQGRHADKPLGEIPRLDLQWMLAMDIEGADLRKAIHQELSKP
jgi:hypothetical protein